MNWIESSIEGSKLFICSGCTCREAISDQEKEAAGRLAESFYFRRDFSGCLAKASPSVSVEAMDSVKSNAAREGSDGSNCDRVFVLFDIFHCSKCDDELEEDRIVYGEIKENINQIREELNGMRQRLKKLLLRNCTEFPPMESITSNVSHTSSGVIDDRGLAINDTEINNKEDDIQKQKSRSEDKAKDTNDHKKNDIRKQRSISEDKDKETADHKKELITPNVSYEWSGVIDKRVQCSVLKDTEIKHQEDDSRKQRSSSEDKIKETDDHNNDSIITSSVSYEWPEVIDDRVHGSVIKDTKTKQKVDDIRKLRSRSEDKAIEAADHKKELMTSKVSYESSREIDKGVHGLILEDTEMEKKEESITSNISYERSGVFENRVHDLVLNDTRIKHKEESIASNISDESSWVIDNLVPDSFLNGTEIKIKEDDIRKQSSVSEDKDKETIDRKKESITSSVSYEWPGVIDNPVHGSVIKDTKTKQKVDDIRKQRSRSEDKAKEAADHKKELMTSKVLYESSQKIEKGVHGLVLKDTEMEKKEDTIVSNVSYESYKEINDRVHGSVFNVTEIENQEDDIRKQRSMGEDEEKEAVDNKKELMTSKVLYESSPKIDKDVHGLVLKDTEMEKKEDTIVSNVSYESYEEINDRVHGSVFNVTEIKNQEDDNQKQRSMGEDKEKETVDNKKESITSSVSYEWPEVIDNPVHGSVIKDTKTKQKEDDIRKQRSRSEDETKEAADHKKELMTSKVLYESSPKIDKGVHGLVLKDTEMEKKEDDIRKQRSMGEDKEKETVDNKKESITSNISYERSGVFENRVHDLVLNETGMRHKEESITSNVSYESSWEINNRVPGLSLNDTEIKNKEDDIRKQRARSENKAKEAADHKKELMTSKVSYESSRKIDEGVHGLFLKDTVMEKKEDDIRNQKSRNEDKAKEVVDHKKELMTSKVSYESSLEIDKGVRGLVLKDIELKQKEDDIRKQRSISEDKGKGTIDRKKESIISDVSYESSRVAYNLEDSQIKFEEDDNRKPRSTSKDKPKEINDQKKESITSNISYGSSEEIDNCVHVSVINAAEIKNKEDDIRRQRIWSKDKAKEAVDHKMESITSNIPSGSSGEIDNHVHGSFLIDTEIKNKEDVIGNQKSRSGDKEKETAHPQKTSTYKQNTRLLGRQKLQRKENIWPVSEVIHYGGAGSVLMEMEIKTDDKTRPRRQRLERGSDVFGDVVNGSVRKDAEITLKEIQDDDIPNTRSNSNVKANATVDDNKDDVPNPVFISEDESEETADDNKETVDSISSNDSKSEGFEVIGEGVPETKPKDTSSHGQKPRPRRQRLQRKGKVWPGYEVIGDGVHGSILMEIEASSYNQKTRQRRQRLQRKV